MKLVWTQEALNKLIEIEEYISKDSPARAIKFVDRLIHDGFLYPSNIHSMVDETLYFIVLNPERILEYLEIKFSSHF